MSLSRGGGSLRPTVLPSRQNCGHRSGGSVSGGGGSIGRLPNGMDGGISAAGRSSGVGPTVRRTDGGSSSVSEMAQATVRAPKGLQVRRATSEICRPYMAGRRINLAPASSILGSVISR